MRINIIGCDQVALPCRDEKTQLPQGHYDSSPVRSAGLSFLKSIRPERDDRQMHGIACARVRNQKSCVSIVPPGRTCLFTSFPSTSYWATFTGSLRDNSAPEPLKLTRNGAAGSLLCPWRSSQECWSEGFLVADLRTQSPPLAISPERTVRANDPKATAPYGHREPVASFGFSG